MTRKTVLLSVVLAGGTSLGPAQSNAKPKTEGKATDKPKDGAETAKPKRDWYPFYGYVASVNKSANTISLKKKEGERVLKLDAKSEPEINGKPALLGSVKIGDYAHGKLHKDSAGNEVIMAAKFDKEAPNKGKEGADKEPQKAAPAKTPK